jgi:hypothetical protein
MSTIGLRRLAILPGPRIVPRRHNKDRRYAGITNNYNFLILRDSFLVSLGECVAAAHAGVGPAPLPANLPQRRCTDFLLAGID